tara:strand:- start:87 stop:272 length:186 start_codon:yes stop_codon:yes gene_type:complete
MQDKHLNELKDKKKAIEINLTNGLIINARIIGIDNFSIIVQTSNKKSLIYKHAIAFISNKI